VRRMRVVAVGRNYLRKNRQEQPIPSFPNLINMVDKLSVPAVAQLVQRCIGTINCHSAISMLGWLENKPQLLLLDDKAWTRHFKKKDLWAFGADFETTTWVRSTQFHPRHLERFLELTCEKMITLPLATACRDSLQIGGVKSRGRIRRSVS
jgi:hypothetical protein